MSYYLYVRFFLKYLIIISSINIALHFTHFNISSLFSNLYALNSNDYTLLLSNDSGYTIPIFSGTKIKINNYNQVYIFDSYNYSEDILYCRKLKAHQGFTVISEFINILMFH